MLFRVTKKAKVAERGCGMDRCACWLSALANLGLGFGGVPCMLLNHPPPSPFFPVLLLRPQPGVARESLGIGTGTGGKTRGDCVGLSLSLVGWRKSWGRKHATTMPTIKTFDFYRKIPLDLTETTLQGAVMSGCAL